MFAKNFYFFFLFFFGQVCSVYAANLSSVGMIVNELSVGNETQDYFDNRHFLGGDNPFEPLPHILFHFILSPFLNINCIDWRFYFYGKLRAGGLFFYYGLLNFGVGFNRSTFWEECSTRIIGINLFQFLGCFILYFFVDRFEVISERWARQSSDVFLLKRIIKFLAFTEGYLEKYANDLVSSAEVSSALNVGGYFTRFVHFVFDISPLISFFTFDFQLFKYLNFSFNLGSFLFLFVSFFCYSIAANSWKIWNQTKEMARESTAEFKAIPLVEAQKIEGA